MADFTPLSWSDAKAARWKFGQEKYGPEWAGKPPLIELLDELVDAGNYIDEAHRLGQINGFMRNRLVLNLHYMYDQIKLEILEAEK